MSAANARLVNGRDAPPRQPDAPKRRHDSPRTIAASAVVDGSGYPTTGEAATAASWLATH